MSLQEHFSNNKFDSNKCQVTLVLPIISWFVLCTQYKWNELKVTCQMRYRVDTIFEQHSRLQFDLGG